MHNLNIVFLALLTPTLTRGQLFDPPADADPSLVLGGLLLGSNSSSLIDSFSSNIARRQIRRCYDPGYIPCPNGNFCCLPGFICQPNNPRGGPRGWCCPSYGLQCSGRACCNGALSFCCGTTCCPNVVGYRCISGQCRYSPPTTTRATTTTPRPTSTSTSTSSSTPSFPTTTACGLSGRDIFGRQAPGCPSSITRSIPATSTLPVPSPTAPQETRIPTATMTFDYQRLRQGKKKMSARKQALRDQAVDQLFESMCKGLKARGKKDKDIFTFTDDDKVKQDNRNKAGCGGSPCGTSASGTSCDEFPFASTTDGGSGAVFSCILVLAQNIQGGVISSFKQRNNMQTGDHYEFSLTGFDCDTLSPKPLMSGLLLADSELGGLGSALELELGRRDLIPGTSDEENESYPPLTEYDSNNLIILSVGDLPAGTYAISTHINQGTVTSLRVIDYQGHEYARVNTELRDNDNNEETLTFTLASDGVGMGFFMDTTLDTVNITSTMQETTGGGSNSNSAVGRGLSVGVRRSMVVGMALGLGGALTISL
ncbi:hypothetical protein Hypma_012347 [Hypsizygus marmoreus]|uniref:Deoxyribonuclease NucA/NucB domain-containing protein n=1 Tax=Hypsizygus marmoreus TaxID=39966 RepID=A0A369KGV5_HYPMA|nr:hypothetical protein Hypma_012347 [Hypsizygus marmoreus]